MVYSRAAIHSGLAYQHDSAERQLAGLIRGARVAGLETAALLGGAKARERARLAWRFAVLAELSAERLLSITEKVEACQ